ncbi:hypothetical protein QCA50_004449 [Cerrena zonata]|uniref:Ricin B lectin domain-containing protein n=1 Tax=Cerrena zonata TaxID=2478898 RepID=A0AAW0GTM0_9APHY
MLGKFFTPLIWLSAILLFGLAIAAPASASQATPKSGKYRIQSASTGLFIDALDSNQADGTPVVVAPLNNPTTANQEWTLDINSGNIGTLQSISSFVRILSGPNPDQLVTKLGTKEQGFFTLVESSSGVFVCATPSSFGCLTSPTEPGSTIVLEPFTGARNQTWNFQTVG